MLQTVFISGTDKRLCFPTQPHTLTKLGGILHPRPFSLYHILTEMEVIEKVEGMTALSDRDTDRKHKLIRRFLRKIPGLLSLTE